MTKLQDIPNVGPSLAADLRRIGINRPAELSGRNPFHLYRSLCQITNSRQDPCVLDVFLSAVRFVDGAPARPWWHYTAERKRRVTSGEWPIDDVTLPSRHRDLVVCRPALPRGLSVQRSLPVAQAPVE